MILSGPEIRKQRDAGRILIDPFDDAQVNPASYDLRLGHDVCVYQDSFSGVAGAFLDSKTANRNMVQHIDDRIVIRPGHLYLLHTAERVRTDNYVPIVDGKSSIGRLGVFVHVTAGFGDAGFDGQYTLEVVSVYPTVLYPGMRIAQIRFHAIEGDVELYKGNYQDEFSKGPQPSRSWKQFA